MDKEEIRRRTLEKLRSFKDKESESKIIVKTILESDEWKTAEKILLYYPILSTEPDITPLLSDKRVLIPFIEKKEMLFGENKNLKKNSLGFYEGERKEIHYSKALMVAPLIAFNSGGYRLGRGGGYYDRYIEKNRNRLVVWAAAFSPSYQPDFKEESCDIKIERIIIPKLDFNIQS